ncbi:sulfatase family protein [Brevifollis gellanilyticus]|uniref:Heparan N-sulfatase n=1 Tax=Brevifollis gellanilyticus TaxID=748831 RepID=A0A512MFR4_9BACT|nr:sulfatase [Brevifollis gellanilyticus]GEP45575.1 heparan N-sulfatase [Brevifollis gellanilyticus]
MNPPSTRRISRLFIILACALPLLCGVLHATNQPNILFIIGDNWKWPTAGILGDPMAKTPAFDRIAREGVLFTHTFNPVPSCSPTRSCLITGKAAHQIGERANLWSGFPKDTPVVTQLLREAGYAIGYSGKPWAPGNYEVSGWQENPVGPKFKDFADFHAKRDATKPFFFWLGNTDTATKGGKLPCLDLAKQKLDATRLTVPPELPDCPEVRDDLMNYYGGVMKLDDEAAAAISTLEKAGQLDNTVIIYTSDNGWQLPRGLANCYDSGSRVPLAVRWGKQLSAGRKVEEFVNVADLGPTFLELAGLTPPAEMSMHSVKNLLLGKADPTSRDAIFIERERHANVRHDNLSYPMRAIRTRDFLYIRNLRPDRWPAGDPDVKFIHDRPFGDVDTTRVKDVLLDHQDDPAFAKHIALIFGKRPAEELYDLRKDPHQISNVAADASHAETLKRLRARVDEWMKQTNDPRVDPAYDGWDKFPYYGKSSKRE